ncbi:MAG TPA: HesA/MoeB/ThiF family protein [Polyangiaceae bacterium]|nr:HesA/MoeB/ThiF family protein [Polyangiaceae bacterium]
MRSSARVLIIGVGGLGCPALLALARSRVGTIGLCDDDVVDRTNLHRQILFSDADVGESKLGVAAREARRIAPEAAVRLHRTRLLPDNALEIVRNYDVVLEGSDNFATKFLASDACMIAGVPIVHASAVRWMGIVMAVSASGRPCYRCIFEDIPRDGAPACAEAGVMGPVVGTIAAIQVDLAIATLDGLPVGGQIAMFDGRSDSVRRRRLAPRDDCPLCGAERRIRHLEAASYSSPACA